MIRALLILLTTASLGLLLAVTMLPAPDPGTAPADAGPGARPSDWFWRQRAFPHGAIDPAGYRLALAEGAASREDLLLRRLAGGTRVFGEFE